MAPLLVEIAQVERERMRRFNREGSLIGGMKRCPQGITLWAEPRSIVIGRTTEQLAVTALCHPARPCQMAVMDLSCAFGFLNRVDAEQHLNGFGPFGAIVSGIEQSHIKLDMRAVILGELIADGRNVVKRSHVEDRRKAQAVAADR